MSLGVLLFPKEEMEESASGGEGRWRGGETVVGIYCIEKNLFSIKKFFFKKVIFKIMLDLTQKRVSAIDGEMESSGNLHPHPKTHRLSTWFS